MLVRFFKRYDLESIRLKFIILYVLNLTDIIFTEALIATGYFLEVNLLMRPLLDNTVLSYLLKTILPMVLLIIIFERLKRAQAKQLHKSNILISGCLLFYAAINFSHIVWVFMYLSK